MTYGGVSGESFSLDPNTGVLTTLRALDREEQEEINLTGILINFALLTVTTKPFKPPLVILQPLNRGEYSGFDA